MGNLIRMDLFKLRKTKMVFIFAGIIFVVAILMPVLGKIFAGILLNIVKTTGDGQAIAEATVILDEYQKPYLLSDVFRSPFGGMSMLWMLVFISVSVFSYMDIANGYVKNIAGQLPTRGHLAISKMIVIYLHNFGLMLVGMLGSFIGYGVTRGINVDGDIAAGLLEFFLKFLLAGGLSALLLLFAAGLRQKTLAIVASVVLSMGLLSIVYLPLSFALGKLFRTEVNIAPYAPDQMLTATKINVWAALAEGVLLTVLFLLLTIRRVNKKDVQ